MFVQVMEGSVSDRAGLLAQMDRWNAKLRPGATGFLGSTVGVTDDGRGFMFARFESREAAEANSQRPEQGDWWAATEKCFDGDVLFSDSDDVDTFLAGGSDDAGFVQIMKGTATSHADVRAMDEVLTEHYAPSRPEVIGGLRVWTGPDSYVEAVYFTSEAEARAGEKQEPPASFAEHMEEFQEMMAKVEFHDLRDPSLS